VLFDPSRPVILNGIEDIVTRADLGRPRRVPDAGADPRRVARLWAVLVGDGLRDSALAGGHLLVGLFQQLRE
jgi:hypothetical protein